MAFADAPQDLPLAALYERHGHAVFRRCRYLLGDDDAAWDATQDVFLKADLARSTFEGRASWRTWLMRVSTHHCLNQLRSQRVRRGAGLLPVDALDTLPGPGQAEDSDRAALLRALLAHFDRETQALAIHYWVDEMTQHEVADAVGLSVPTVRKRLEAFLTKARRLLGATPPLEEVIG